MPCHQSVNIKIWYKKKSVHKELNSAVNTVTFYRLAIWGMSDGGDKIFHAHPDEP
jgi:hypothetical protein